MVTDLAVPDNRSGGRHNDETSKQRTEKGKERGKGKSEMTKAIIEIFIRFKREGALTPVGRPVRRATLTEDSQEVKVVAAWNLGELTEQALRVRHGKGVYDSLEVLDLNGRDRTIESVKPGEVRIFKLPNGKVARMFHDPVPMPGETELESC